ncbi:hypothetical protein ACFLXD_00960 [Chloroflexota bacterium]
MREDAEDRLGKRRGLVHLIIGILVFGSLWGFFEATLGGFLNMIIFPNKGAIMSGIGVAIMGGALAIYRKPSMLPGIGIVAASFKLLNVWFLFVPIGAVHVINPAMAIILESLAFSLVAAFLMKRIAKNATVGIGAGILVGLVSATAYVYFAIHAMNAPLFERMGVSSIGGFIANQGMVQAVFFGILLPLGYLAGEKISARTLSVSTSRPLYYATSAAVICLCWVISAVVVMLGF